MRCLPGRVPRVLATCSNAGPGKAPKFRRASGWTEPAANPGDAPAKAAPTEDRLRRFSAESIASEDGGANGYRDVAPDRDAPAAPKQTAREIAAAKRAAKFRARASRRGSDESVPNSPTLPSPSPSSPGVVGVTEMNANGYGGVSPVNTPVASPTGYVTTTVAGKTFDYLEMGPPSSGGARSSTDYVDVGDDDDDDHADAAAGDGTYGGVGGCGSYGSNGSSATQVTVLGGTDDAGVDSSRVMTYERLPAARGSATVIRRMSSQEKGGAGGDTVDAAPRARKASAHAIVSGRADRFAKRVSAAKKDQAGAATSTSMSASTSEPPPSGTYETVASATQGLETPHVYDNALDCSSRSGSAVDYEMSVGQIDRQDSGRVSWSSPGGGTLPTPAVPAGYATVDEAAATDSSDDGGGAGNGGGARARAPNKNAWG